MRSPVTQLLQNEPLQIFSFQDSKEPCKSTNNHFLRRSSSSRPGSKDFTSPEHLSFLTIPRRTLTSQMFLPKETPWAQTCHTSLITGPISLMWHDEQ